MGYHNPYPRPLIPTDTDPAAVDFRAFYPYTPNEVKHRKRTTSAQLKVLEGVFKKDTKPNATLRNDLALELGMTARGVQVWFQNRRAKEKVKGGKGQAGANKSASEAIDELQDDGPHVKDEAASDSLAQSHNRDSAADEVDAFSRSPDSNSSSASPPQLHLITDANNFPWQNSPVEPTPDSATLPIRPPVNTFVSNSNISTDFYPPRRGSLPANAFPHLAPSLGSPSVDSFDPLVRRCSVDASLQRLANNPFASLARAKNSALFGPGVGVAIPGTTIRHHHQFNRLPYGYHPRRVASSSFASMPQHASMRRLSMDSRPTRLTSLSRTHQSESPSPITPYNAAIRVSLPDQRLYTLSSRPLASPIPGPLPSPGFSFGAASTPSMASPSSGDSERNSPDSLRSFTFRGEEHDDDSATSPSYDAYSRFGSIASIATSESSVNSSYYAEIGGPAVSQLAKERRDSCASGHFIGMLSGLNVEGQVEQMQNSVGYASQEEYSFPNAMELVTSTDVHRHQQQQQVNYPSPTSTITSRDSPHNASVTVGTPNVPISTSSELAFALESKPDQVTRQDQYLVHGGSEQQVDNAYYAAQAQQQQAQEQKIQLSELTYPPSEFSEAYANGVHQQHLDYMAGYNSSGGYADPLSTMDNGMQSVDAFTAYT
ncbi:hypothetical protein CPB84DRAFT_1748124 [Gymnopilus junonius]|uniref:Homeobox domain-containing protein n=1 Tax=Gymnopilus junonius TaxID=109634 RepID=A0A9P5NM36_GYMJU|nr:hypothetical protein CPB84DRAFT_1748124 [Gymnopilus junonius]